MEQGKGLHNQFGINIIQGARDSNYPIRPKSRLVLNINKNHQFFNAQENSHLEGIKKGTNKWIGEISETWSLHLELEEKYTWLSMRGCIPGVLLPTQR